ncbi:MAG: cobalamin-dependent protein [Desulfamplus sp.]|nr:cobalamin-dependent protein [Desulfamplus sp.]MBF0411101.1 cobalamin-dependent protein [Desulfamplus sp.]
MDKINRLMDEIIKEASSLPFITLKTATAHHVHTPDMVIYVNSALTTTPDIYRIIGNNPLSMMYDNHKHHAAFMSTVFNTSNYELLVRTVSWVYRAYHTHGFQFDYFLLELNAWIRANNEYLDKKDADAINVIYEWLISRHNDMISIALSGIEYALPVSENWLELKNNFQSALLDGDHRKALELAMESTKTDSELENFYLHIIQPSMYEIGMMWEKAEISVAQEHLASAIVGRIMASVSSGKDNDIINKSCGRAIVTASPNEFHEIGAWMIADTLEHDGWDVRYLGANMPKEDLILFIKSFIPDLLAISVTMPFNLSYSKEVIAQLRSDNELKNIKVMIGGRVFNETPRLWESTGADGFAPNLEEAKSLARRWATI